MGRKSKWSPELQDDIAKSVRAGIDVESACAREGISKATLYQWVKRGEKGEEPYASFASELEQAFAEVTRQITFNVVKASETDWKAAAWWLERRRGSVYGPPRQHIVTHEAIAKEVDSLSESELLEIAQGIVNRGLPRSVDDGDEE